MNAILHALQMIASRPRQTVKRNASFALNNHYNNHQHNNIYYSTTITTTATTSSTPIPSGYVSPQWANDQWCDDENNNPNFDGRACCNNNNSGWDTYCTVIYNHTSLINNPCLPYFVIFAEMWMLGVSIYNHNNYNHNSLCRYMVGFKMQKEK